MGQEEYFSQLTPSPTVNFVSFQVPSQLLISKSQLFRARDLKNLGKYNSLSRAEDLGAVNHVIQAVVRVGTKIGS